MHGPLNVKLNNKFYGLQCRFGCGGKEARSPYWESYNRHNSYYFLLTSSAVAFYSSSRQNTKYFLYI